MEDKAWISIPLWNGRPESFSHFLHEVKWTLSSSKKEERALLAAKIVRKALQSGQPTLVQLMYKLEPDEFKTEEDVHKLVTYLEQSPLNRQALPDAGAKIGSYYRRLHRRGGESVPAFLVREDKTHDEMLKALQRLLREKELTFEGYDMSLAELKAFCGIQDGESLYYGEPEGFDADEADDASSQKSSQKTTTPTPSREGIPFSTRSQGAGPSDTSPPKPKGRDVIERLMQKGLIPLAALDVIRGWMVLEMTVGSDEDRRLIRAATRNKLGYTEIKAALLSMYEDKTNKTMFSSPLKGHGKSGHGKSGKSSAFYGGMEDPWKIDPNVGFDDNEVNHVEEEPDWDQSAWWTSDTSWYGHAWNGDDTSPKHEASEHLDDPEIFQHLMQEQDEYERQFQELQALTAESERNLAEARRAVSLAARDRGWNQPPQQRQPRYTSAYPFQKGKRPEAAGKGRMMYGEDAAWFKGAPGGHKGKSKSPSRPYSKGKGKDLHFHEHYMYPIFSAEHNPEELLASESIVDTGATATAGGRWAVQQLCSAVMNSRPNADMRVYMSDRPWFRFGNGRWGQALFKVCLSCDGIEINMYSLPSPGVPVLTGMRELEQLNAILGCSTGKCLIKGHQTTLRRTPKRHLVLDYLKDVFMNSTSSPSSPSTSPVKNDLSPARRPKVGDRIFILDKEPRSGPDGASDGEETQFVEVHDLWMFSDFAETEDGCFQSSPMPCPGREPLHESTCCEASLSVSLEEHFEVKSNDISFLLSDQPERLQSPRRSVRFATDALPHGQRGLHGTNESCHQGGSGRTHGRDERSPGEQRPHSSKGQGSPQESERICEVRRDEIPRARPEGSEGAARHLAMLRQPPGCHHGQQPLWPVDGMCQMRPSSEVHTDGNGAGSDHKDEPADECDRGHCQAEVRRMGRRRDVSSGDEVSHRSGGQAEGVGEEPEAESQEQGSGKEDGRCSPHSGFGPRARQRLREGRARFCQEVPGGDELLMGSKADHDMHHDGDEEAGEDARHRALESAERQKLLKAAEEFNVGAFLASLQDCGKPFVIWEVCCHPESALTNSCRSMGLTAWRKTLEDHYDIEKDTTRVRLLQDQVVEKPKRTWWSLKCTPWTNIQNINQRNESQIEMLKKKRRKARRGVKVATQTILDLLDHDPEVRFYWEWPKSAYAGWSLAEMQNFVNILEKRNIRLFWTQLDGCMFGVKSPQDEPLKKEWLIMNNDADFHSQCHVLCDGSHVHRDGGLVGIGSVAVEATGYYPKPMTDMIAKRWKSQKEQVLRKNYHEEASRVLELMTKDIEMFPVQQQEGEATKKEKEKAEALLHKLHKASGHPTNRALARLCADRGMPGWMVQMAKELKCAACVHSQQGGQMVIPYSLGAKPGPWHFVSADVMDLVFPALRLKARVLVATCVVMKFLAAKVVWTGEVGEAGTDPGRILAECFAEMWLAHRPRPSWVLVDPQTSLASGAFVEFLQMAGIGVSVSPPEAHWQQGTIESLIRVLRRTVKRLREEHPDLQPQTCINHAVAAHNHNFKANGFTPVQWAYGYDPLLVGNEVDPMEYNAHLPKAPFDFWQTQKLRQEAADMWKHETSVEAWTRLKNAAPRQVREFQVGEWVCVWRTAIWKTRKKSVNPEPRYVGPGRIALIEPAVIAENKPAVFWVLMGTQIWRTAPEQLRRASEQEITIEELQKGQRFNTPIVDMLRKVSKVVDAFDEPGYEQDSSSLPSQPGPRGVPQEPAGVQQAEPTGEWQKDAQRAMDEWRERRKRERDPGQLVREQAWRWKQLVSTNENRRREGLPPVMELPPFPSDDEAMQLEHESETRHFQLDGPNDLLVAEEAYENLVTQMDHLEATLEAVDRRERLREQIERERKEEERFMKLFFEACEKGEEACVVSCLLTSKM